MTAISVSTGTTKVWVPNWTPAVSMDSNWVPIWSI